MNLLRFLLVSFACILMSVVGNAAAGSMKKKADQRSIERGRYVVEIGGCNDCHTAGYIESGGATPEGQWLLGSPLGWRGPWGTTYPPNLRLIVPKLSEDVWVKYAKTIILRPPMPWFALHDMTTDDLRAVYRFIRFLGPAGKAAPDYLPPGKMPNGPYVQFPSPPPAK